MNYILLFLICFILWLALTFKLTIVNLIAAAFASLLTAFMFGKYFTKDWKKFFNPVRYFWLIVYIPYFLWECLKANLDVAYRVLHPALPIKPGIVKVKSNLKTEIAKVMLACSITMTPGTLAVDLIDDMLYIHWINVSDKRPEKYTKKIAGRFEFFLKRIFE